MRRADPRVIQPSHDLDGVEVDEVPHPDIGDAPFSDQTAEMAHRVV